MASRFSSWDSYFWEPGGPVLRNLYGERDAAVLAQWECGETSAQQFDIERGAVSIPKTYDAEHLRAMHKELFGNVYEWAGEYRTVGIRKNLGEFAHPAVVPQYLSDANRIIRGTDSSTMDRDQFASAAAEVYAYVNQAHPFREGNGRSGKLFMQHVSELSPFRIDYSPAVSGVSPELWNQASMLSGPDRGQYAPQPASLVTVSRAMAVERPPQPPKVSAPDPSRDPMRDRSPYRASFPKPATGATRPGTSEDAAKRPPQRPGQSYGVGRD
ncbi:Fic/DOC family protein [Pseudoclavibacter terrae]|uniref:protein adenylyltransferase n=1 Tax=Pseudoclavibacter terrae TaxID=1530195 RepID=A0A7J5AXL3_9MICO|nr:Fic family protein [Pseudoclavibacter terrae]KAB1636125.1 cell filamentation protein Fic [Pseudoclavibacter terrae]